MKRHDHYARRQPAVAEPVTPSARQPPSRCSTWSTPEREPDLQADRTQQQHPEEDVQREQVADVQQGEALGDEQHEQHCSGHHRQALVARLLIGAGSLRVGAGSRLAKPSRSDARRTPPDLPEPPPDRSAHGATQVAGDNQCSRMRTIRSRPSPGSQGLADELRVAEMSSDARPGPRILGSLRSADGTGIVRIEDRYETDIDGLWSALTDPGRLARWYSQVEGDLRPRRAVPRTHLEGWDGTGRWKPHPGTQGISANGPSMAHGGQHRHNRDRRSRSA